MAYSLNILYVDSCIFFFFNDTATTEIYTLSLHDALPILRCMDVRGLPARVSSCPGTWWTAQSSLVRGENRAAIWFLDQNCGCEAFARRWNCEGSRLTGPGTEPRQLTHDIPVWQRHAFILAACDRNVDGARLIANKPDVGVLGRSSADRNSHSVDPDLRTHQPRSRDEALDVTKPVANGIGRAIDDDLRRERAVMSKAAFVADLALREFRFRERVLPPEIIPVGDPET